MSTCFTCTNQSVIQSTQTLVFVQLNENVMMGEEKPDGCPALGRLASDASGYMFVFGWGGGLLFTV